MFKGNRYRAFGALTAICAVAAALLSAAPQRITSRDALWKIVHDVCVPGEVQNHDPKPCVQVDLQEGTERGFAILKDIRGATQFLLIPTAPISGIESPRILAPDAPNYFAEAWDARSSIDQVLHQNLPRDDIGLAINSVPGRSQDQLHIHIDCIQPSIREALQKYGGSNLNRWAPLDAAFSGHRYSAMWVSGDRLGANNPFRLLAKGVPGAAEKMGDRTLVVIGVSRADGTPGFVILEDQVQPRDLAYGEELLDHSCRVARATHP